MRGTSTKIVVASVYERLGDDNVWDFVARVEKRNHAASHAMRISRRAHGRAAECQPGSSLRGLSTKASSIGYPHCDACTCTFDPALYFVHPVYPSLLPHGMGSRLARMCSAPFPSLPWFRCSRCILIAILLHVSVSLGFPGLPRSPNLRPEI
jgi:hypothetical protein